MADDKVNNTVEFLSVSDSYPPSKDLTIGFKCPSGLSVSSSDWIGIFKVGWVSTRDYYTFEWVAWSSPVQEEDQKAGSVTFAGRRIPPSDENMYQFCYVGKDYSMKGCSRPFTISAAATDDFNFIDSDFVEITSDDLDQLRSMVVINTTSDKKGGVPAVVLELKETVARLTNEKDGLVKELTAAKQNNAALEEELVEKQKAFEYIQQNSNEIVKEAEEKQALLDEMSAKLQEEKVSADKEISTLSEKLVTAQEENDSLKTKVSKLEEENSDLKLEIGKLLADLEQSQGDLKASEGEKADLVTSKLSLEKEIKLLKETTVSRDAFEALQQAQKSLKPDLTEEPQSSIAIVTDKEILEARNEELVAKLNMCKEEYTQKCYEVRNLQKQLTTVKVSGGVPNDSSEAIESVMQELESRREKCKELEEKNAKFEELNVSLEERVLVAEHLNQELTDEKISSEEKYESMIKSRDEEVSDLTQQILQLNEELASIRENNANKIEQMTNAVRSLHAQLEEKDKEIIALKKVPTPPANHPQNAHSQRPPRGQLVISSPNMPPAQGRPPSKAVASASNMKMTAAAAPNAKECPMCQVKFPASFSNSEFEAHVQSHFEY